jgi:probable addiction module antidote protein
MGGVMSTKLKVFDIVDFLETDEDMQAYLNAALEEGDTKFLFTALGDIVRAKNISQLSRETGISREGLYKALSGEGNPAFNTIFKIIHALGMDLQITATRKA